MLGRSSDSTRRDVQSAHQVALASAGRIAHRDAGVLWRPGSVSPLVLPGRGHGLARLTDRATVVITARRPGTFLALVDVDDPAQPRVVGPASGCKFSGHSAVHPDGFYLVSSEFDAATMQCVLVARDTQNGAERECWRPKGIEPHESLFAQGRLIVALGGLHRDGGVAGPAYHPDGIDSAIVEVDPRDGAVTARHRLPDEFVSLSLRHLAATPDGQRVVVGMQDQDLSVLRPLMAIVEVGRSIEALPMPDRRDCDFRGYVGSVAVDAAGDIAGATSPRGNVVGFWSLTTRAWIGGMAIPDVCGLTAGSAAGGFWASSGFGAVMKLHVDRAGPRVEGHWRTPVGFDNHLIRI